MGAHFAIPSGESLGKRQLFRIGGQFIRESGWGAAPPCCGPLHSTSPGERPRLLSRLVARYPPPPAVSRQPLSVTKEAPRLRPQCAGAGSVPAPPAPPPPRSCGLVLGLVVLPCLWPGRCRRPLWLHSRNHLGCRPPHPRPCSKRPLCLAFSQGLLTPPTPQPTTGAAFITRPPSPIRAPRATNRMMAAYTF